MEHLGFGIDPYILTDFTVFPVWHWKCHTKSMELWNLVLHLEGAHGALENQRWLNRWFFSLKISRKGWSTKPAQQFTSKHEVSWYNPIILTLLADLGCHIACFFPGKLLASGVRTWDVVIDASSAGYFTISAHAAYIYVSIYIYICIWIFAYIYISIYIFGDGMLELKTYFFDGNGDADIHTSSRIHTKMHSTCSSDVSQTSITYFLLYVFFSPILCSLSFCRFPLPTTTIFMQCLCMTLDSVEAKHLLNYIFFYASFIL